MSCRNLCSTLISEAATLPQLRQIHCQLIAIGRQSDLLFATKLSQKLSDLGAVDQAHKIFSSLPRPDLFLFNVLIKGHAQNSSPAAAISLYARLRRDGALKPDNFTFAFAVSAASSLGSDRVGRLLHAHSIVDGFQLDLFVGSALMDFYLKFAHLGATRKVFDGMSDPDTVCWNTMISGLLRNCLFSESLQVFEEMLRSGASFDATTLAVVLPAAAELQDLRAGRGMHCLAVKRGVESHSHVVTGLISVYSKCGEVASAKCVFGLIEGPDLVTFNAMISGCSFNGDVSGSLSLFTELQIDGLKPNPSTIVGLIPVFTPFGRLDLSQSIHGLCVKAGFHSQTAVATALTTVYARLNEMDLARGVFDEMPVKSLPSWNAMISGYSQNGWTESTIELFQQMQLQDIQPNPVTVTSTLSACAQFGVLSLGKRIHDMLVAENLESNVYVSTALIDMYAKCGAINQARRVFQTMPGKNVVSWNAMISGYGLHGEGDEALKLYKEMLSTGIKPTKVTFLSVLYACSHAGQTNEGRKVFHSMVSEHGLQPGHEHNAGMVDLLGRAGQLQEALEFIERLPTEPDPGVWGALLGACMKHKNMKLATMAADRLFQAAPQSTGYYVLLSNIYSASQKYSKAATVRQLVQKKRLGKTPGCSLIEIGGTLHVFTSGDRSHPRSEEIYSKLEVLMAKMKEFGFSTETNAALYDVEEEEKEHMVKVHSEKLATALGLISTQPHSEISIIKNLRVCLDCHNATKFISKITERMIIVRDANRFHHFRDGFCSCGDYW